MDFEEVFGNPENPYYFEQISGDFYNPSGKIAIYAPVNSNLIDDKYRAVLGIDLSKNFLENEDFHLLSNYFKPGAEGDSFFHSFPIGIKDYSLIDKLKQQGDWDIYGFSSEFQAESFEELFAMERLLFSRCDIFNQHYDELRGVEEIPHSEIFMGLMRERWRNGLEGSGQEMPEFDFLYYFDDVGNYYWDIDSEEAEGFAEDRGESDFEESSQESSPLPPPTEENMRDIFENLD